MSSSPIEARTALKQTEIGPEPSDWETIEVGRVCRIENGCPFESAFFNAKEGLPLIRIRDVHSGQSETLYSGPYEEKYVVNDGDLLVGMDGEFRVRKWRAGKGLLNQRVCRLVPDEQQIDKDFVYFSVGIPLKKIEDFTPYTTVKHISATQIRAIVLPHPPLTEQRKIAAVLGMVQRAIEKQERLIALTTELKKALLHQLFTQGLRGEPQKQTEIGPVPESWEVTRLDDFCILQRGFDITKKEQVAGNIPVVSSGGIASYHNLAKVKGPGVIVGRKGTLGTVHYVDVDYWPHDTTLWVKDFKGHDPLFTSYFLKTLRFERYNSGASNPTLNRNTVHAELVAYPKAKEQEEIGLILRTVENKERLHERKHATLTALFHTLLHQLMTAQIRVDKLDIEELIVGIS